MPNPLYQQLNNNSSLPPVMKQFIEFRKTFTGNPQQAVQNLINSGRISQDRVNQLAQQANELYRQFKGLM